MRKDLLNRFKKAIVNIKAIEKYFNEASDKSFVKYSMLKDVVRQAKELREKMEKTHEEIGTYFSLYVLKGIEFEYEVRSFYKKNVPHYRWLLDL
mgnify:CR=1 FL=1